MADELHLQHETAKTVYAILLNGAGQAWNGAAFEPLLTANWANYDLPLAEQSTTGIYLGSMPAVPAGLYDLVLYEQQGGAPATTDPAIALGQVPWSGTAIIRTATVAEIRQELDANSTDLDAIIGYVDALETRLTADRATALDRLDAAISTRATAAAAADAVWDEALLDHVAAGSVGAALRLARALVAGRKTVEDDQLLVYDVDGVTLLATLDLTPAGGPYHTQTPA